MKEKEIAKIWKRFPATLSFDVDVESLEVSEGEGGREFQITPKLVRNNNESHLTLILESGESLVFMVKMDEEGEFKCGVSMKMAAHPDVARDG